MLIPIIYFGNINVNTVKQVHTEFRPRIQLLMIRHVLMTKVKVLFEGVLRDVIKCCTCHD